ncbi:MAG: hypothetical protein KAJ19_29570 [Gammaproteobacteria bacterium]|nr:hypothetical protein [Gammaproteobacteria bacterium]
MKGKGSRTKSVREDPLCWSVVAAMGREALHCMNRGKSWNRRNRFRFKELGSLSGIRNNSVLSSKLKKLHAAGYVDRVEKSKRHPRYRLTTKNLPVSLTEAECKVISMYDSDRIRISENGTIFYGISFHSFPMAQKSELSTLAEEYQVLGLRFLRIRNTVHGKIMEDIWAKIKGSELSRSTKQLFLVLIYYLAFVASSVAPMVGSADIMSAFDIVDAKKIRSYADFNKLPDVVKNFVRDIERPREDQRREVTEEIGPLFGTLMEKRNDVVGLLKGSIPAISRAMSVSLGSVDDEPARSSLEELIKNEISSDLNSASRRKGIQKSAQGLLSCAHSWMLPPKMISDPWLGLGTTSSKPPGVRLQLEPLEAQERL